MVHDNKVAPDGEACCMCLPLHIHSVLTALASDLQKRLKSAQCGTHKQNRLGIRNNPPVPRWHLVFVMKKSNGRDQQKGKHADGSPKKSTLTPPTWNRL